MPNRTHTGGTTEETKEGFTGKEKDYETNLVYFGARYYDPAIGRFFTVDNFADQYPSMTPYQYAANNPIIIIDVNGDSIEVSAEMEESEALANYLNTEEGYNQIAQFAYEGQTITVNGQTFTFENAGQFSTQNVNFAGVVKSGAETVPVNSVGGKNFIGKEGKQTYNVYISENTIGNQMDDIFHEVQHSSMFAGGSFTDKVNQNIIDVHHGNMMLPKRWAPHERYLIDANTNFNANINLDNVHQYLYNQIESPTVANKVVEILNKINKKK